MPSKKVLTSSSCITNEIGGAFPLVLPYTVAMTNKQNISISERTGYELGSIVKFQELSMITYCISFDRLQKFSHG